MNYIQEHSFSDYEQSSLLSLEHYIPDQEVELVGCGSVKYSVGEKCHTLESELQCILELNDRVKAFSAKISRVKNRRVFEAFNSMRVLSIEDSLSYCEEESSLQTFIYNLHNAKLFLDLIDLIVKRKEQKKTIEAFMRIKTVKKKVVLKTAKEEKLQTNISKFKPALLLLKAIFTAKMHNAFISILKDIRDKKQRSINSAFTDISFNSYEFSNRSVGSSNYSSNYKSFQFNNQQQQIRKNQYKRKRESHYQSTLKEQQEELFSKKYRSNQVIFRK